MNLKTLRENLEYVKALLRAMHTGAEERALTADEQTEWDAGTVYVTDTEAEIATIEARSTEIARFAESNPTAVVSGADVPQTSVRSNPYDMGTLSFMATRSEVVGRARTALEQTAHISDAHRAAAERTMTTAEDPEGKIARHILATGSEAYRTAFQKVAGGAPELLTPEESQALVVARAASLTDAAGGFAVPFTLDPTIIDTGTGSVDPFRETATIKQIVTDTWNGVSSAGVSAAWAAEAAQAADGAPTLAQPSITAHKAHAFVPYSIEVGGDWANIENDLRMMMTTAKDDLDATAHTLGTGSGQPFGTITKVITDASSVIASAGADAYAVADVYATEQDLAAKHRARAHWFAAKSVMNLTAQFATANNHAFWTNFGSGQPQQLRGYPIHEAPMDGVINAAAENYILLFGDPSTYYIVDRVGLSIENIPHIMGANNRPTGQRGIYAWWRTGADVVNTDAWRVLNVT